MTTLPQNPPAGNAGPAFHTPSHPGCDGDPASDGLDVAGSPDVLLPFDVSVADAPPPFPEPPAGLTLWAKDAELVAVFRTAWPHLAADQRAEVSRLIGIAVRSAQRHQTADDDPEPAGFQPPPSLARDWHELQATVATAYRLAADHAAGWIAAADRQADPYDDAWPRDVPAALAAAGFVLANVGGIQNAEVYGSWGDGPARHVFPLGPLPDAAPAALPADRDGRRDKLGDVAALLAAVADDLGRCMSQQERRPGFDPRRGDTLLDTLGGGRLALEAALADLHGDLEPEIAASLARLDLVRLRTARRVRAADAVPDRHAA